MSESPFFFLISSGARLCFRFRPLLQCSSAKLKAHKLPANLWLCTQVRSSLFSVAKAQTELFHFIL